MRTSTYEGAHRPYGEPRHDSARRKWRVLVAVDGTAAGQRALAWSLDFAEQVAARVTAVVIQGRLPVAATTISEVDDALARKQGYFDSLGVGVLDDAAQRGVYLDVQFRHGPRIRVLKRETASTDFDLVVVGQPNLLGWLVGAGSPSALARRLTCPTVIVK